MGREVRRVPLDFDWPTDKIWPGFCISTPDCRIDTCPDATHDEEHQVSWSADALCTFHRLFWDDYKLSPKVDPPEGEGWQLWETVSEGSPISPVFDSPESLARWMASPAYTWALSPILYETALRFVHMGWAPSMVSSPETGLVSGEQFIGRAP